MGRTIQNTKLAFMIWLLDNGHGGILNGVYQTKSKHKKSPELPDGTTLFEGEWNRKIVSRILKLSEGNEIKIINIVPEIIDIDLDERARRVNSYNDAFVISIHMNGTDEFFTDEKRGITTFYYRYNTGRKYAWIFQDHISDVIPNRGIFEKGFRLLTRSKHPCLLLECGFMNNLQDVMYLKTEEGINNLSQHIYNAILETHKTIENENRNNSN